MELYLIRHWQSANNLRKQALAKQALGAHCACGDRDAHGGSGADRSRRAAGAAGRRVVRDEGITTLYCGPMLRTLQTAQIVGTLLDLSPQVFVGLHEGGCVWEPRDDGNSVSSPD